LCITSPLHYQHGVIGIEGLLQPFQLIGSFHSRIFNWQIAFFDTSISAKYSHLLDISAQVVQSGSDYNDPLLNYRECLPVTEHDIHWIMTTAQGHAPKSIPLRVQSKISPEEQHLIMLTSEELAARYVRKFSQSHQRLSDKLMQAWSSAKPFMNLIENTTEALFSFCRLMALSYKENHDGSLSLMCANNDACHVHFNRNKGCFEIKPQTLSLERGENSTEKTL
tara:strand:+ start:3282 stop:3950 length:669 start_codon:yes stop_codon:yes gene_type:complete